MTNCTHTSTARKYLITGGAGFIGSHLCDSLLQEGNEVTILDDLSTGRWQNIAHLEGRTGFRVLVASAADVSLVRDEVPRHDFVYHLASAVGVQLVVDQPVDAVVRTIRSTEVLVDACARYRRPILLTSSSEVYGKSEKFPFCEDDDLLLGPSCKRRWAYASAKLLAEFLLLAHYQQTKLPVFIVRLFNTVGPRQSGNFGMVLPRFVAAAKENQPLRVFGDGSQKRCFCSVFDTVRALVLLSRTPAAAGNVINIGNDSEISMMELAKRVIAIAGSSSSVEVVPYTQAYGTGFDDMLRRIPSLRRAKEILHWEPTISLDDIIRPLL